MQFVKNLGVYLAGVAGALKPNRLMHQLDHQNASDTLEQWTGLRYSLGLKQYTESAGKVAHLANILSDTRDVSVRKLVQELNVSKYNNLVTRPDRVKLEGDGCVMFNETTHLPLRPAQRVCWNVLEDTFTNHLLERYGRNLKLQAVQQQLATPVTAKNTTQWLDEQTDAVAKTVPDSLVMMRVVEKLGERQYLGTDLLGRPIRFETAQPSDLKPGNIHVVMGKFCLWGPDARPDRMFNTQVSTLQGEEERILRGFWALGHRMNHYLDQTFTPQDPQGNPMTYFHWMERVSACWSETELRTMSIVLDGACSMLHSRQVSTPTERKDNQIYRGLAGELDQALRGTVVTHHGDVTPLRFALQTARAAQMAHTLAVEAGEVKEFYPMPPEPDDVLKQLRRCNYSPAQGMMMMLDHTQYAIKLVPGYGEIGEQYHEQVLIPMKDQLSLVGRATEGQATKHMWQDCLDIVDKQAAPLRDVITRLNKMGARKENTSSVTQALSMSLEALQADSQDPKQFRTQTKAKAKIAKELLKKVAVQHGIELPEV